MRCYFAATLKIFLEILQVNGQTFIINECMLFTGAPQESVATSSSDAFITKLRTALDRKQLVLAYLRDKASASEVVIEVSNVLMLKKKVIVEVKVKKLKKNGFMIIKSHLLSLSYLGPARDS